MGFSASMKGENEDLSVRYIDWLLTPAKLREPAFQHQLAAELGVTEQTLRNWRKEPVFQRTMTERARGYVKAHALPDILEALGRTAVGSSPQQVAAAKLLIDFMEKGGVTPSADLSKMTADQLREFAQAALAKLASE